MANEQRTILYSIKIDAAESAKNVGALTDAIDEHNKSADAQEQATRRTNDALKAETGSIAELRAKNKELTQQRNQVTTATEEGRKKIQQINAEIDANNKRIKENVDAYTKQKLSVGDYTGALDKLVPGLGATANGFAEMTKAALRFIATPIGIIITAIAAALYPLISFLKNTGDGMDLVEQKTEGLSQALGVLERKVNELGAQIAEEGTEANKMAVVFTKVLGAVLPVTYAIKGLVLLFPDLAKEMRDAAAAGEEYARTMDDINTASEFFAITVAKERNAIRELIIESKNRTLSEEERIAKTEEAIQRESQLAITRKRLAEDALSALVRLAKTQTDLQQENDETQVEFAQRMAEAFDHTNEKLKKSLIKAIIDVSEAEAESLAITEKLLNQQDKLHADLDARNEKRRQERIKREQEDAERKQAAFDYELEQLEEQLQAQIEMETEYQRLLAESNAENDAQINAKHEQDLQQTLERDTKARETAAKKQADNEMRIAKFKAYAVSVIERGLFGKRKEFNVLLTSIFKKNAIQETLINTKAAAVAAYKSLAVIPIVGPVLGGIAAAAAAAFGALQIAAMTGIQFEFAKGGRTNKPLSGTKIMGHHGQPITRPNGDNLLATVKVNEVILNEEQQARLGGAKTFRRLGVPGFADGGNTYVGSGLSTEYRLTDTASDRILQQIERNTEILTTQKFAVVYDDIEAKQLEKNSIVSTAQIV